MKKRILSALLAVVMAFGIIGTFGTFEVAAAQEVARAPLSAEDQKRVDDMTLYLTSPDGIYEFYMDEETADFAYVCVPTGEAIFSTPHKITGSASQTAAYRSTILLTYKNKYGTSVTLNSYVDAYEKEQIVVKKVKGGVRVEYTIGEEVSVYPIPVIISKEDFETKILEPITNNTDKRRVSSRYSLYDITGLDPTSKKYENLVKNCPACLNGPVYMLSSDVEATSKTAKTVYDVIVAYTEYSYEDYMNDLAKYNTQPNVGNSAVFRLALEYTIDNDGLNVTLYGNSVTFDESEYTLENVDILPYLAAASKDQDGYVFVPDGSGAITRFKDARYQGKTLGNGGNIYGIDYVTHVLNNSSRESYRLPVFGLIKDMVSQDESGEETVSTLGYVAFITDGEAVGSITAKCEGAGRTHSAWASVRPMTFDHYNMDPTNKWPITIQSDRRFTGTFSLRYIMLHDEEKAAAAGLNNNYAPSYVGMADAYRDYLIDAGVLTAPVQAENVPLFIESFGSVLYDDKILTFPITVDLELTTFKDVETMWTKLTEEGGIENVNFILTGFANDGISRPGYPTTLKWTSSLGGKSGLNDLISFADKNNFKIYPNFDFVYSQSRSSSGLSYKHHAARTIDNRYAVKRVYDPASQMFVRTASSGVAIAASAYEELYEKFHKYYSKYDFTTLGVMSMGSDLNSDFDEDEPYHREDNKIFTMGMLEKMASEYELLVAGGNYYSLPYADVIVNLPTDSSLMLASSESIPFAGMVLHGYKVTTGEVLNSAGDTDYAVMKAIENGVGVLFQLSYQNVHYLKDYVQLSGYYAVDFQNWYDEMVELYHEINNNMKELQGTVITEHEFLSGYRVPTADEIEAGIDYRQPVDTRVVRVEYGEHTSFILNYNYDFGVVVECNGMQVTVPALGYAKIIENNGTTVCNYGNTSDVTIVYNGTTYTVAPGASAKIN